MSAANDDDIKANISGTAFLVNESRNRRQDVSLDRFAGDWVPMALRPEVDALWADYAKRVYEQDDIVCSLRNRYFLDALNGAAAAAAASHSPCHFLSFGAGFTSYPWLLETPLTSYTEIDMPKIVQAKQSRIAELSAAGKLPPLSNLRFLAGDFLSAADRDRVAHELVARLGGDAPVPSVCFMEGLTYYLSQESVAWLFDVCRRVQAPGSLVVVSYWNKAVLDNSTFKRQMEQFESEYDFASKYCFIEHSDLEKLAGFDVVELTSCAAVESRYMTKPELKPDDECIVEYMATLKRV